MIRDKLRTYFTDRGFQKVDLHMSVADLFYLGDGASAQLVWIISNEWIDGLDKESYGTFYKKIFDTFVSKGFSFVNAITLFLGSDPKKCAEIAEGTAFWVVDENYGRVVVYENQPEDFAGIRLPIEQMVSTMLKDKIKYAEEETARAEARAAAADEKIRRNNNFRVNRNGLRVYKYQPFMTYGLIIINVVIFLLTDLLGSALGTEKWSDLGAVSWMSVFEGHEYYRLFTCMFLHGGIDHIAGNMLGLYATGSILENAVGHVKFIILYIGSGVLGAWASSYYYFVRHNYVVSVGASGACYAIIGALVAYFITHRNRLRYLNGPQISMFVVYMGYSLVLGFRNPQIDNAAHVAGLIAGTLFYLVYYVIDRIRGIKD